MKHCNKCNTTKPLSEFHKKAGRKDGHSSTCKACVNNRKRPYDPRANKNSHLKRTYGITVDEYEAMLESQGGVCAICGGTEKIEGRLMAVDHCHTTGAIRGILCSNCNRSIGLLGDNIDILKSAIKYLGGE